jgi:predicted O-methyltransferase YrrM
MADGLRYKDVLCDRENYIKVLEQTLLFEKGRFRQALIRNELQGQIAYHIDQFSQKRDFIQIEGWAFLRGKSTENSRIFIVLKSDATTYVFPTMPMKRPDVAFQLRTQNHDDCGFSASIPNILLGTGKYEVGILIRSNHLEVVKYTDHKAVIIDWKDVHIPKIASKEFISHDGPVCIYEEECLEGNISNDELMIINGIILNSNPTRIFEIGTFDGRTTLNMAMNAPKQAIIYTLDLPRSKIDDTSWTLDPLEKKYVDKEDSGTRFKGKECEKKIVQLLGDAADYDFSPYYGKMDLVFVDGSHSFEYALNDTEIAMKLLKGGEGIILWHNYDVCEGVTKALNELFVNKEALFKNLKRISGTSLVLYGRLGNENPKIV